METDDLRELLMLAEKRSYAATADALFMSPSALSRHIAALENRLGVTLFYRNSRSVLVTQHGELLLSYARKITQLEDEYLEKLSKAKREEGNGIRIGTFFGLAGDDLMAQVAKFLSMNRELSIKLQSENQNDLLDMLRVGTYDFAFVQEEGPTCEDEFERMTVAVDRLAVVLPQAHPVAQAESVRLSQLRNEVFLLQESQCVPYRLIMEAFRRAGVTPNRANLEFSGLGLMELVEQGLGIALEQEKTARKNSRPGVALVPLEPTERIWVNLVWNPENLSAAGRAFVAYFRDVTAGKL